MGDVHRESNKLLKNIRQLSLIVYILAIHRSALAGFPGHGINARILDPEVLYETSEWIKVKGWEGRKLRTGMYSNSLSLSSESSEIQVLASDIYFVSVQLAITLNGTGNVQVAVVVNNDFQTGIALSSKATAFYTTNMASSGFIKLLNLDTISIYVKIEGIPNSFTIRENSMFNLQRHDSTYPGFQLQLQDDLSMSAENGSFVLDKWSIRRAGHFVNCECFNPNRFRMQIPLPGVYIFSLNLLLRAGAPGFVNLSAKLDTTTILLTTKNLESEASITLAVSDIISINSANSVIFINLVTDSDAIFIDADSSWSVMLLKADSYQSGGFRSHLGIDLVSNSERALDQWNLDKTRNFSFEDLSTVSLVAKKSFNAKNTDTFFVAVNVYLVPTISSNKTGEHSSCIVRLQSADGEPLLSSEVIVHHSDLVTFVSLLGVFELSNAEPVIVHVTPVNINSVKVLSASQWSVLQTSSSANGVAARLESVRNYASSAWQNVVGWTTADQSVGIYDFKKTISPDKIYFVVPTDGVYLISSNIVISNVDDVAVKALLAINDRVDVENGMFSTEGHPEQTTTITLAGVVRLGRGDRVCVMITTDNDEDWSVLKSSGLSAAYVGIFPVTRHSRLGSVRGITSSGNVQINNWVSILSIGQEQSFSDRVIVPVSGVHTVTATIILVNAYESGIGAHHKIFVARNGVEIPGIYGKKSTEGLPNPVSSQVYTLSLAGAFYAEAFDTITIHVTSTVDSSYSIRDESGWSIVYLSTLPASAGFLATLSGTQNFAGSANSWLPIRNWAWRNTEGRFHTYSSINLDRTDVAEIMTAGLYFVAVNIEVSGSIARKNTFQIALFIQDEKQNNGVNSWVTSSGRAMTLNALGTLYLRAKDTVGLRLFSSDFTNVQVSGNSGWSVAKLPEPAGLTAFNLFLQQETMVTLTSRALEGWTFSRNIASTTFTSLMGSFQQGKASISFPGFYLVCLATTLQLEANIVYGVSLNLKYNNFSIIEEFMPTRFGLTTQSLYRIIKLNAGTDIAWFMSARYDPELVGTINNFSTEANGTDRELTSRYVNLSRASFSATFLPSFESELLTEGTYDGPTTTITEGWSQTPYWKFSVLSSPSVGEFHITPGRIYLMMADVMITAVGSMKFSFLDATEEAICEAALACLETCNRRLQFHCMVQFNRTTTVQAYLYIKPALAGTGPSMVTIDNPTKRIIAKFASAGATGGFLRLSKDVLAKLEANTVYAVGVWTPEALGNGKFLNNVQVFGDEIVIVDGGIYQLAVNLILEFDALARNCSTCNVRLVFGLVASGRDEDIGLQDESFVDGKTTATTLAMMRTCKLQKWHRLKVFIKTSASYSIRLTSSSSLSLVLIEPAPYLPGANVGPVIMKNLTPDFYATALVGRKQSWECLAFGEGPIIYRWLKNNAVISEQRNTAVGTMTLNSALEDTGVYACEVDINGITAKSNDIQVIVFDVDECFYGNHSCSVRAICVNNPGSYDCVCKSGYSGDGNTCTDINECLTSALCVNATCINVPGDYNCRCLPGYFGIEPRKGDCKDLDECAKVSDNNCDRDNGRCINTIGSFNCSCRPGWTLYGNNRTCEDIDECSTRTHDCDANAVCANTIGSYTCACKDGYTGSGQVCYDLDECEIINRLLASNRTSKEYSCKPKTSCLNTAGSYKCVCKVGFTGDGEINCFDIDECQTLQSLRCATNADCANTEGSYSCKCRPGLTGDGTLCLDINECISKTDACDPIANCSNTYGSYECICPSGFVLSGKKCEVGGIIPQGQLDVCEADEKSFKCVCRDPAHRDKNILCNGLFVALIILAIVSIVVLLFVVKYMKNRKLKKIGPARTGRDKYIEMDNESEL